jgi:rare lipoprotein A
MAHRARSITTPVILGVAAMALSACASNTALLNPRYPARLPSNGQDRSGQQAQAAPRSGSHSQDNRGGTWKPYEVNGHWYYPEDQPGYDQVGTASWYGDAFNGKPTADGEIFDMYGFTAAHKTLPLPSVVEVTNLDNGKSMQVRVNDRGPFVGDRLIDLSKGAADQLGVLRPGLARVRVRYVGPAPDFPGRDAQLQYAQAAPPPKTLKPQPAPPRQTPASAGALPKLDEATLQPLHDPDQLAFADPPLAAQPVEVAQVAAPVAPPVVAPIPAPSMSEAGGYAIQAASFSSRANAEKAASQLASVGRIEIASIDRNGTTFYRLYVRSLRNQVEAGDALQRLAANGYGDAKIVAPN